MEQQGSEDKAEGAVGKSDGSLWLCSDKVDWAPARRAVAFVYSAKKAGVEKAAGFGGVGAAMAAVALWGSGWAIPICCMIGVGAAGLVYGVGSLVVRLAEKEANQALALTGKAWSEAVEERGGKLDKEFMNGIRGAVPALAFFKAKSMTSRGPQPELKLGPKSVFGAMCLALVAGCDRRFGGEKSGWSKVEEKERVDHWALTRKLLPGEEARLESVEIQKAVAEQGGAPGPRKAGPRRM